MYTKYRFSKQLRKNDCVPNAIINLMKFFGTKIPYKNSYKKLYNFFKIPLYGGTHPDDLRSYLMKDKILNSKLVNILINPNLNKIVKSLKKDKAMIVAFHDVNLKGHACLLTGVNKKGFELINYCAKKTVQTVTFDKFQKNVLNSNKSLFYVYERKVLNGEG